MSHDDEVVEVFTGDSLEQAMAYAVAALGPDLQVRRARKVRKGVAGLAGRDKYEVVAVPSDSAPNADPVDSAFDALLSQAEQAEQPGQPGQPGQARSVRRTTRPTPHPAPAVAEHHDLLMVVQARQPALEPAPRAAEVMLGVEPEPVAEAEPEPIQASVRKAPKTASRTAATTAKTLKRTAAATSAATGWSHQSLAALGVPQRVLDGLPAQDPADDLSWAASLAAAIATVLPAPAALSEQDPVVVDGHGLAGALGILAAAELGLTPGTITAGGRTAPATAAELALVIRAAVITC